MPDINVFIRKLSANSSYPLKVNSSITIRDLKDKLLESGQFDHFFLKCGTATLNDDSKSLAHYQITENQTIYVLARLRGGN